MKSAKIMPKFSAEKFMSKTNLVLEAQLLYAGIELDIFKDLNEPITSQDLAIKKGFHKRNLELLLNALTSIDYLKKENNKFSNLPETNYYLNSENEMYLGEHILYWRDMTSLENIVEKVKNGPIDKKFQDENGSDFFDFRSMGQGSRNTMYLGRVQAFINQIEKIFDKNQEFKVLDMGGGTGILSIEIARNFKGARGVVFDQASVINLTDEIIKEYNMQNQIKTKVGNFVTDEFNEKYDLIIATGVLDFVGDLDKMVKKLYGSLSDDGYIYVGTHGLNKERTAPKRFILGWLSSHLDGLDILKPDLQVKESFLNGGFEIVNQNENGLNYIVKKCGR